MADHVRNLRYISDMMVDHPPLSERILDRMRRAPKQVWTPGDFVDIENRDAVDKALQRLVKHEKLRRIDRGLYDVPTINGITGNPNVADYRAVIVAVARRDKARFLIDGMTAANALGLTNAVPARIEVLIDARLKPIQLGNQKIIFKQAAPSRLYWAGRPGMYLVQALYWIQDVIARDEERARVLGIVRKLLADRSSGADLRADLENGLSAMPIWMQDLLRPLLFQPNGVL